MNIKTLRSYGGNFILGAGFLCAFSTASGQTADEIIAANIAATGGADAIARIENFTSTGKVHVESPLFGQLDGTIEAVHVPGSRYYEKSISPSSRKQRVGMARRHGSWDRAVSGCSKAPKPRH